MEFSGSLRNLIALLGGGAVVFEPRESDTTGDLNHMSDVRKQMSKLEPALRISSFNSPSCHDTRHCDSILENGVSEQT